MEYDDVLIVNNETSIANAGTNLVICTDAVNLSANNPVYGTGAWTLISGSGNIANINDPSSLVSNLGQGKNDLKWTITNLSCISEAFVSITNNTPSTANAGLDQTICFDTTILYPNTPSIGVGSWSLISGSGTFSGNVVKNLAPNQNTLRYTITQGTCKSTDDVLITNDNPTTPSAGYDQSLCINTAVLNGNPITQGNGLWSIISGSGSFSSLVVNNPTVTGIADGINIYRWTVTKNGCSEQDEVIVSNNFVLATAGEDVVLCVDNTQLNASNPLPGIGTWSVVGNSGATFDNQNSPNSMVRNLSKGDNTFRWTVTNVGCVSFDEVQVTNNQPTQALAGENQSVCSKTAILNANQALFGTGVWSAISGSATFADQNSNQTTVSNLAGGPNVLRWTISKGFCLSYDEVIITSNLPVNVFAGNDQIACSSVAVLSANPPSNGTGQWSIITGAGSFVNRTLYNTAVTNLGQGENVFKWTVSNSDCHISDTVTIKSSIPSTSIAGSSQIICSETTTLGGNTPLSGTGSWSVVSGSVEFTDRSLPNTTIKNIARGLNILAWIIDKDGCQSSSELTITNNLPSTPFAGYDIHICGDSIRLFADPPSIGTGVWSLVSGDAAILNNTLNQTRVINIKFGDNTFRWKLTNKNCMLYDDVIITSDYAYANAGADREVNTSTIQLIGNVPAAGTGTWSLSAGQASILNPNQFDTWVNNLGSGANIFTWNINNNGCIASDEMTINYIVMPIADFTPSTIEGCSPFSVNFVNTSIGGIPYSWNFGDGTVSNETNIVHTYNSPGTYKVILTATGPLGLTVKKEGTVIVNGHPKAVFDIAPKVIYIPGQRISCFNYSLYAKTSIWDFGDGNTITELAPRYAYSDTGRFDITLKVLNTFNCADSITLLDIVHVKKRSELFFPEAFTPNPVGRSGGTFDPQDRSNDVFYPIIIDGEITDYELKVYNRSGVLVFKSNDIKIGWDGYYKNKLLPQDVYIYMVSGRYNSNEAFQEVHNVLLIKKDN
jgi:gliding motility-associated-like protein